MAHAYRPIFMIKTGGKAYKMILSGFTGESSGGTGLTREYGEIRSTGHERVSTCLLGHV